MVIDAHKLRPCLAPDCDILFEPEPGRKKETCSQRCYLRLWRSRRGYRPNDLSPVCAYGPCDTKIPRHSGTTGRPQLYCCTEHRNKHSLMCREVTKSDKHIKCANPTCETGSFTKKHGSQQYCTVECRTEHNNYKKRVEVIPKRTAKLDHVCHYCGTDYMAKNSNSKFCKAGCRTMFNRQFRLLDWVHIGREYVRGAHEEDNIAGEIFINCRFVNYDFTACDLTKAHFINCHIEDCVFDRVMLHDTKFKNCDWHGTSLMDRAYIYNLSVPPNVMEISNAIHSKLDSNKAKSKSSESLYNRSVTYYD